MINRDALIETLSRTACESEQRRIVESVPKLGSYANSEYRETKIEINVEDQWPKWVPIMTAVLDSLTDKVAFAGEEGVPDGTDYLIMVQGLTDGADEESAPVVPETKLVLKVGHSYQSKNGEVRTIIRETPHGSEFHQMGLRFECSYGLAYTEDGRAWPGKSTPYVDLVEEVEHIPLTPTDKLEVGGLYLSRGGMPVRITGPVAKNANSHWAGYRFIGDNGFAYRTDGGVLQNGTKSDDDLVARIREKIDGSAEPASPEEDLVEFGNSYRDWVGDIHVLVGMIPKGTPSYNEGYRYVSQRGAVYTAQGRCFHKSHDSRFSLRDRVPHILLEEGEYVEKDRIYIDGIGRVHTLCTNAVIGNAEYAAGVRFYDERGIGFTEFGKRRSMRTDFSDLCFLVGERSAPPTPAVDEVVKARNEAALQATNALTDYFVQYAGSEKWEEFDSAIDSIRSQLQDIAP